MSRHTFWIGVCAAAALLGAAGAEPDPAPATIQLTVELSDGCRLNGVPAQTSVPIISPIGKIDVPLAQVTTMTFQDDHEGITVALVNGDRLTGVQSLGELRMKTLFGDIAIKPVLIRKIECRAGYTLSQGPTEGLIAWYPLEGNAKDASGNRLDGIPSETIQPVADRFGRPGAAIRFTGDSSYIRVPNFVHSLTGFAACVWVKPSNPGPLGQKYHDIISKHGCPEDLELLIKRDLDGKYGVEWNIGGVFYDLDSLNTGIVEPSFASWDFLVLQYTGASIQFYMNGKLMRERKASGKIATNPHLLTFGGYGTNPADESYVGLMDDIRLYNRALSVAEIEQLYKLR